jgi:hypothetical protein
MGILIYINYMAKDVVKGNLPAYGVAYELTVC